MARNFLMGCACTALVAAVFGWASLLFLVGWIGALIYDR